MIAILDYGAGNLHSVRNAVACLGYEASVISKPEEVNSSRILLLPGVGAAGDTMNSLKSMDLIKPLKEFIADGRPFLGICIGLQILFTSAEEGGSSDCLDIIRGKVTRLPGGLKVPHMGWNQVRQTFEHPVFAGIPDGANFYFAHSYYATPDDESTVAGITEYGIPINSVIACGNIVATQFHPEKSGVPGLRFLQNFIENAGRIMSTGNSSMTSNRSMN